MIRFILFTTIFLSACGTQQDSTRPNIDIALVPYVEFYERQTGDSVINITIEFKHIESFVESINRPDLKTKTGICFYSKPRHIVLDYLDWFSYSEEQKHLVLWHELGHCLHDLDHDNFERFDGCGQSLMADTMETPYCADRHFLRYLREYKQKIN